MTATIITFPDRRTLVTEAAGSTTEAQQRAAAVEAGLAADQVLAGPNGELCWFARAHHVLDHIEDMLEADDSPDTGFELVQLCDWGLRCLGRAAPDIDDTEMLFEIVDRLRDLHLQACRRSRPDGESLADLVFWLARGDAFGVVPDLVAPYAALLDGAARAALRRRITEDERRRSGVRGIARRIEEFRLDNVRAVLARSEHPSAV